MKFTSALYHFALIGVLFNANPVFADEKVSADYNDEVPTSSIIDVLSGNASFSNLLHMLQKSDLIDYVNQLENVTFLAPVNSAFEDANLPITTKLTLDQINRFIIEEPISRSDIEGIVILSTLNRHGSPYIDDFDIDVLVDHRKTPFGDEIYKIENSDVISEDIYLLTVNSVVLSINHLLLDPKQSVCEYFEDTLNRDLGDEQFKVFSSFLISDKTCHSLQMSNMTFIAPSDQSLGLNKVEQKYLTHVRGIKDKELLLSNFLFNGIIGGNLNSSNEAHPNWNDQMITFSSSYLGDEIILNNKSHATSSNYLLSDGIIHYFENPIGFFDDKNIPQFTPRKYLIGLNYEDFVDEIDFRKLSSLIDDSSINQTVFVSGDYSAASNMQNQLLYHFIDGNNEVALTNDNPTKLLNSKFCLPNTNFCQKIKLEYFQHTETLALNSNTKILNKEPYQIGNTSIYILDDDISVPPKLQVAIASELTAHGKSITYFKKFGLLKQLSKDNSIHTIFFPSTKLWNTLGLTLDYLESNHSLLKETVESLVIEGILYENFEGSSIFQTHSHHAIEISKGEESTFIIDNSTEVSVSFDEQILFSNGIVHPIDDQLPLPKGIKITTSNLLDTQESDEFVKIIEKLNLTSVFNASMGYSIMLPPSNTLIQENITDLITDIKYLQEFAKLHILPPGSLDMILDCYADDLTGDRNFTNDIPTMLENTHLTCRQLASGSMMLSLTEGSNNEVRILRHGLTIDQHDFNSGIFLLDRPLNPVWLNKNNNNKLYLHLPLIAIFLGILIGIVWFILIFGCCLVITVGKKDSGSDAIDAERRPLLTVDDDSPNYNSAGIEGMSNTDSVKDLQGDSGNHGDRNTTNGNVGSKGKPPRLSTFESKYSINSSTSPINVNHSDWNTEQV